MPKDTQTASNGGGVGQGFEVVQKIKNTLPQFRGDNPAHLKSTLLTDKNKFNKVTGQLFQTYEQEQGLGDFFEENPEEREKEFKKLKNKIHKDLSKASYTGRPLKQSVVQRELDLVKSSENVGLPVSSYKGLVQQNKNKYQDKYPDLFEDGQFTFTDSEADTSFMRELQSNSDLFNDLLSDQYEQFTKEMNKSHNNTTAIFNDPKKTAKAYGIYNRFGSEALTQYMNTQQVPGEEEDDPVERQQAKARLEEVSVPIQAEKVPDIPFADQFRDKGMKYGVDPALLAGMAKQESSFDPNATSSKGARGVMQLLEDTAKVDLGIDPEDLGDPETNIEGGAKYFSRLMDKYGDKEKALAAYNWGMGHLDTAIREHGDNWKQVLPEETREYIPKVLSNERQYQRKKQKERRPLSADEYGDMFARGMKHEPLQETADVANKIPKDFQNYTAFSYERQGDQAIEKGSFEFTRDIYNRLSKKYGDGEPFNVGEARYEKSDEYQDLVKWVYKEANAGKMFTWGDLRSTLMSNATDFRREDGEPRYTLNFNQAHTKTKLAADALRMKDGVTLQHRGHGMSEYRPERRKALNRRLREGILSWSDTQNVVVTDEDGNKSIQKQMEGGWDIPAQVWNSAVTIGAAAGHFGARHIVEPATRLLYKLGDKLGAEDTVASDFLKTLHDTDMVEGAIGANTAALDLQKGDNFSSVMVGNSAPFVEYLGAMVGAGRGILKGGTSAIKKISEVNKASSFAKYANGLKGTNKFKAINDKIAWGLKNSSPWTMGPVYYTGGAAVEAVGNPSESFYRMFPQFVDWEPLRDMSEKYATANDWSQTVMDIGASLVVDSMADTIMGGLRYGKDMAGYVGGKQTFKGSNWNWKEADKSYKDGIKSGDFETLTTPEFKHDLVTFWKNATRELDVAPMGEAGESLANEYLGRAFKLDRGNAATLHDYVKLFSDESDIVMRGARQDIEEGIRDLNKKLGGADLDDGQIRQIADAQYEQFMEKTTNGMYSILRNGNLADPESLPLRFAQALDETAPATKEVDMSLQKARESENHVIKQTDDGPRPFEIQPKYWTADMARRIRKRASEASPREIKVKHFEREGINHTDPTPEEASRMQEIESEIDDIYGQPVRVEGNLGYVQDFTDEGWVVKTTDGTTKTVKQFDFSRVDQDRLRKISQQKRDEELSAKLEDVAERVERMKDIQSRFKEFTERERQVNQRLANLFEIRKADGGSVMPLGQLEPKRSLNVNEQTQLRELVGRRVDYGEYRGTLRIDEEGTPIVDMGGQFVEIPVQKDLSTPAREVGLETTTAVSGGRVVLGNKQYTFKEGLESFNVGDEGVNSVTLLNRQGREVTFGDQQIVEDLMTQKQAIDQGVARELDRAVSKAENSVLNRQYMEQVTSRMRQHAREFRKFANAQDRLPYCN